jgi:signal transduction histidine kinase/ligand-binding sensor domain-containing protein
MPVDLCDCSYMTSQYIQPSAKIRLWQCGLLLVCLSALVQGQYRFDYWTTDQGLPQNTISSILQTRDGYLWFTTLDGLVRYDGVRFTVFDKSNTKNINSNRFTKLNEDREGNLWVGSEDGGLLQYRQGSFVTYTTREGLPDNLIRWISDDPENGVVIATQTGLARWHQGQITSYSPAGARLGEFSYLGRSGALWSRDESGLHCFKDGRLTTYPVSDSTEKELFLVRYESRDGNLWVSTRSAGLQRWQAGQVTRYTANDGLPPGSVTAFAEDRQGNLWVGTDRGSLCRFQNGRFTVVQTLGSERLIALHEDREGNFWVGTFLHGLYRLRREVVTVYTQGLDNTNVYPIFEDRAGNIWIGGAGLSRYSAGTFIRQPLNLASGQDIASLAEDREGRLWFGGLGHAGWLRDGKFTDQTSELSLAGKHVFAILEDRVGNLWFGTNPGVIKLSGGLGGQITLYTAQDGLANEDVKEILEDRQGRLWFATYGGLSRFEGGRFTSFTEQDGLASNRVRTLYEDDAGVLWIGSYDGGLTRLKDGRFTRYTTRKGLFNNGVFRILEDQRGNFWMSSNRGIYRVSRQQLNDFAEGEIQVITSVSYGQADGLSNTECNGGRQPAGWKTRDGKLWFPTQGGVAVIDPQAVLPNPQPPPVLIENCIIDSASVAVSPRLRLAPGQENLELHYTGLSFIKSEYVRFKYQLVGLDQDWVDVGPRRVAYFNHLPPGEYTFRVIAANSDGVWNTEGATLPITVIPHFWQTWWFRLLSLLLVIGLIGLSFRWRITQLRRKHAAQEAFSRQLIESQESERKRIAAELHDSLGQSLVIIKNRALLSLSKPEDHEKALTQMEEISAATSHAIEEVKEIAYNLHPYQLDRLGLTTALESMIQMVAATSGINFTTTIDPIDGALSKEAEINLYRIVQESLNNIVKHSEATAASVLIKQHSGSVQIKIQDNGKGFVKGPEAVPKSLGRGLGLTGMVERAKMLGARHEIRSATGQGTTIIIELHAEEKDGKG